MAPLNRPALTLFTLRNNAFNFSRVDLLLILGAFIIWIYLYGDYHAQSDAKNGGRLLNMEYYAPKFGRLILRIYEVFRVKSQLLLRLKRVR